MEMIFMFPSRILARMKIPRAWRFTALSVITARREVIDLKPPKPKEGTKKKKITVTFKGKKKGKKNVTIQVGKKKVKIKVQVS